MSNKRYVAPHGEQNAFYCSLTPTLRRRRTANGALTSFSGEASSLETRTKGEPWKAIVRELENEKVITEKQSRRANFAAVAITALSKCVVMTVLPPRDFEPLTRTEPAPLSPKFHSSQIEEHLTLYGFSVHQPGESSVELGVENDTWFP
ncbi:hypothetical protein AVEN_180916-1 [Araneus ventricosus]|uniref:Uncharacterized protein n=1 Tax=Araneus ventricosus TaxID=182803 RepID=A0A4Y2IY31_ARAVE|nr:hypothetical protein AVEN_180916-1 [Araneus ventricosus]